jgi:FMN phosphatase YigB (HAD superfamily)
MKRLSNVAFDLDGTLIKTMPVFERILWEKYQAKVPEVREFKIFTEPDLPFEKIVECFNESFSYVDEFEIIPGAQELLQKVYSLTDNDPIRIVTARTFDAAADTYKLCERICQGIDWEVVIVKNSKDKWKHLHNYKFFVDDRRKTALELASHDKLVLVPRKHYNQPIEENENISVIDSLEVLLPWANGFIKEVK